jgi:hypothetical protein
MKPGFTKLYLFKPGVRVQVNYEPGKKPDVIMDDDINRFWHATYNSLKGSGLFLTRLTLNETLQKHCKFVV